MTLQTYVVRSTCFQSLFRAESASCFLQLHSVVCSDVVVLGEVGALFLPEFIYNFLSGLSGK